MKKVGPTLKVASVILQVISISAKFAGIPFPHASKVIDQVVEYSEKAQEIFGNCAMKIESLKEMTKEDIIKRMNQNGTSELKLQPLEGDIIGTFKNNDMFGESQVFSLLFSFLSFFFSISFSFFLIFSFPFSIFFFILIIFLKVNVYFLLLFIPKSIKNNRMDI